MEKTHRQIKTIVAVCVLSHCIAFVTILPPSVPRERVCGGPQHTRDAGHICGVCTITNMVAGLFCGISLWDW